MSKSTETYFVVVLDQSGSMHSIRQQAISHFNEHIQTLKASPIAATSFVSLLTFNEGVETVYKNVPVNEVQELTESTYLPRGSTALFDAIGQAIETVKPVITSKGTDNAAAMINIITDGEENCSKRFNSFQIKSQVEELQATKAWTFTFMGADKNILDRYVDQLGLYKSNTATFNATASGMATANSVYTRGLASYADSRSNGTSATVDFFEIKNETTTGSPAKVTTP